MFGDVDQMLSHSYSDGDFPVYQQHEDSSGKAMG
jgi:hypothetical protein